MLKRFLVILFSTLACAASIGAAATVKASPLSESVSIKVKYSDLDLGTTAGAKTLLRRIRGAAEEICGVDGINRPCVEDTVNGAVARLNSPVVTALNGGDAQVAADFHP
jgi:UrcA family protein